MAYYLKSSPSVLNGIVCKEPYDATLFKLLKNSSLLRSSFRNPFASKRYTNERQQLNAYERLLEDGFLLVRYNKAEGMTYGRSNPDLGLGLYNLRRELRQTLACDTKVDIDIVNCHPQILYQIAKKNGDETPALKSYITNRSEWLDKVVAKYGLVDSEDATGKGVTAKEKAKNLFIRLLYFGSFKNWAKDNGLKDAEPLKIITRFTNEVKQIGRKIVADNPDIKREVSERKKKQHIEEFNEIGSVVSYYLQEYEVQILDTIYTYCVSEGIVENNEVVLCADGLMVDHARFTPDLLPIFSQLVKDKFDFDLEFLDKPQTVRYTRQQLMDTQINTNEVWAELARASQVFYAKIYYDMFPTRYIYHQGNGWYEYQRNNTILNTATTPTSLKNNISRVLQEQLNEYRNELIPTQDNYNALIKLHAKEYVKLGTSKFIEGIIDFLKDMYLDQNITDKLDVDMNVFAFENGLYDFTEHTFRDILPSDYITKTTKYNYVSVWDEAIQTDIRKILLTVFGTGELVKYYLLTTGSSVFTNRFESIYFHTGEGGNGKGALSTLVEKSLGDYFYQAPNTFLTTQYKDEKNPALIKCKGVRYILVSEPSKNENNKINQDFVRMLTGGDTITCRDLYSKGTTSFKMTGTPFVQCNKKPELDNPQQAEVRRLKDIPYPFKFLDNPDPTKPKEKKKDETLKAKIASPRYFTQFILTLLDAVEDNYDEEGNYKPIVIPEVCKEETSRYINTNNTILPYLDEYAEKGVEGEDIQTEKLLVHFKKFAEGDDKMKNLKQADFIEALRFNGIELIKKASPRYLYAKGVKAKSPYQQPPVALSRPENSATNPQFIPQ